MITSYKVAGLTINIDGLDKKTHEYWEKFQVPYEIKPVFSINVLNEDYKRYKLEFHNIDIGKEQNILIRHGCDILLTDSKWYLNTILPLISVGNFNVFSNQIFYSHAIRYKMVQIHSSVIQYKDNGILFVGPSGVGKTTQAELWMQYRDAEIINGDMAFVQQKGDNFYVWGTPWHGSSVYCKNTSAMVRAIIVLCQDSQNMIHLLSGKKKIESILNNVIYPQWLENGMELCLETLDHLLSALPVYELSCRPDEEAVRLTEEAVFGRG